MTLFPVEERLRAYIKSRTERLQKRKRQVGAFTALTIVALLVGWVSGEVPLIWAVFMLFCVVSLGRLQMAQSDIHIDVLGAFKRDLDRDLHEGLEEFELP